jgi:hypothetical protein
MTAADERTPVGTVVPIETLKFTFVTSSTFSCLTAEVIWVRFSAGGAAVAEVAALPVVLLSEVEGLVSAVGFFMSFEVVVGVV